MTKIFIGPLLTCLNESLNGIIDNFFKIETLLIVKLKSKGLSGKKTAVSDGFLIVIIKRK